MTVHKRELRSQSRADPQARGVAWRGVAWRGLDDGEYETLEYVDWFTRQRTHGEIGMVPPAEFEAAHYHQSTRLRWPGSPRRRSIGPARSPQPQAQNGSSGLVSTTYDGFSRLCASMPPFYIGEDGQRAPMTRQSE
jgi:hypothetical protein